MGLLLFPIPHQWRPLRSEPYMTNMEVFIVILGMTLVTVITRSLLMMTGRYWMPSNSNLSSLRYAPAAGLAALIAPDILQAIGNAAGPLPLSAQGRTELAAILVSIGVFYLSRHSGLTLLAGVGVYILGRL